MIVPANEPAMLWMAILPMTLIGSILVATALDERGFLGPSFRLIGIVVPLAVVATSLSLGTAALFFVRAGDLATEQSGAGLYAIGAGMFHLIWAQLYLVTRALWAAAIGAVGSALALIGSMLVGLAGASAGGNQSIFLIVFQVALILLLVPAIAPTLAARLAEREMPIQRAVVLAAFGVASVAMFTFAALVGWALPVAATSVR